MKKSARLGFFFAATFICSVFPVSATLRPPQPPWPQSTLKIFGFDSPYQKVPWREVAFNEEESTLVESWSGYALERSGLFLLPIVIPVNVSDKEVNLDPSHGAIRFWLAPNWSTANEKSGGPGPGHLAHLLELVNLGGKISDVRWALFLNEAGDTMHFVGQTKLGLTELLKVPVTFTAGDWRMITLCYSETNTALLLDGEVMAKGEGVVAPAAWAETDLGLVVGSDVLASPDSLAEAQFEELTTMRQWPSQSDWQALYFQATKRRSLLGALGTKEEEQTKVVVLKAAGLLPEDYGLAKSSGEGDGPIVANSYAEGSLWLEITGVTNGLAALIVHGTTAEVAYEILSKESLTNSEWAGEQVILGAGGQDWTPTTVTVGTRTNQLFLWARTLVDTDGDGLPDWWELAHGLDPNNPDTGNTGVSDGYKDGDNDGWNNLQEYQNGTNPSSFTTPHAPNPVMARIDSSNNVVMSWGAAGGVVSEYVVLGVDWSIGQYVEIGRVAATNRTYVDAGAASTNQINFLLYGLYGICTNNEVTETNFFQAASDEQMYLPLFLMYGAARQPYAVLTPAPPDLEYIHFNLADDYGLLSNIVFDLSVTNFQNGIAILPSGLFGDTGSWYGPAVGHYDGGNRSTETYVGISAEGGAYVDAAKYLKANLNFLLRAATTTHALGIAGTSGTFATRSPSPDSYEFYPIQDYFGGVHPDTDNYLWLNFLWSSTNLGAGYIFDTGAYYDRLSLPPPWNGVALGTPRYTWSAPLINLPANPPVVVTNNPNWVFFDDLSLSTNRATSVGLSLGANGLVSLAANARNIYGLPITAAMFLSSTNGATNIIGAGTSKTLGPLTASFFQTAQPNLQTVDYYFTRGYPTSVPGSYGTYDFQTTNTTPLLVMSVNEWTYFNGYAKQAILNGYTNKFAYLGQYFDKALKIAANGTVTTNETGILSEYGEFFSTEVGRVALVTKPDIETGQRGTGVVHVIKIQLDLNHDGVMDLSLTGPDNNSWTRPYEFWANNDFDRGHKVDCVLGFNCDWEEDDLGTNDILKLPVQERVPDCLFTTNGVPAIPSMRDLEDYARVWIPGLSSLMVAMPTNYTAQLIYSGTAPLRLFRAYETGGGTNYLFNEVTASNQVARSASLYLGSLADNAPIILNGKTNLGEHFIFCATGRGNGSLGLQIFDEHQNLADETWVGLEIKDIKEMYERWTVGDNGSESPWTQAMLTTDALPTGSVAFEYPYNAATDSETPYILHVHGWNMPSWEKDRFGESMFKRLYWQGYQGRFGIFRWPTLSNFPAASGDGQDLNHFDESEQQAWESGRGLRNLLVDLNAKYPDHVRLTAHSMGNVTAGEALRTNTALVTVYVAMQAAVPAGAYDLAAPFRAISYPYADNTPELYRLYCTFSPTQPYFYQAGGASAYINFYNPLDWALDKWLIDQNLKPADTLGFNYATNTFFQFQGQPSQRILTCPSDTYELFAYGVEGQCWALGAQTNVTGVFQTAQQVNLNTTYSFGAAHKGHSAQFRSTNMKRAPFWTALCDKLGVLP